MDVESQTVNDLWLILDKNRENISANDDDLLIVDSVTNGGFDRKHFGGENSSISAVEFMSSDILDEDLILDIDYMLKSVNLIDDFQKEITDEFKDGSIEILNGFVKIFNQSIEFVQLQAPLNKLIDKLLE